MDAEPGPRRAARRARAGVVGTLVAIWWALDGLVQLVVIVLAAWTSPILVFVVALVLLTAINNSCCNWIERHWDGWMVNSGKRLEKKLAKMRTGRLMRHPVDWIQRSSDLWFALAAALTNAITTVAIARLLTGRPIGRRRVFVASASFSLFVAGIGALFGLALGDAIRAA